MSRIKRKNPIHVFKRAAERTDFSKREAQRLIKEAQTAGKAYGNIPPGPLADYIKSKGNTKRVKVYQGYVFIFARTSTACITMYPIPEEVLKAQDEFEKNKSNQ